jgi:hypothetical protein
VGGRRFQASNFKANFAYLSKEIMISDVIVVNAHTKTGIGATIYCAQWFQMVKTGQKLDSINS